MPLTGWHVLAMRRCRYLAEALALASDAVSGSRGAAGRIRITGVILYADCGGVRPGPGSVGDPPPARGACPTQPAAASPDAGSWPSIVDLPKTHVLLDNARGGAGGTGRPRGCPPPRIHRAVPQVELARDVGARQRGRADRGDVRGGRGFELPQRQQLRDGPSVQALHLARLLRRPSRPTNRLRRAGHARRRPDRRPHAPAAHAAALAADETQRPWSPSSARIGGSTPCSQPSTVPRRPPPCTRVAATIVRRTPPRGRIGSAEACEGARTPRAAVDRPTSPLTEPRA